MLPITHGVAYTKKNIVFYTLLTAFVSILPYVTGMSGLCYLVIALISNLGFCYFAFKLYFAKEDAKPAIQTFHYSILYLTALFVGLLIDHALRVH